LICQLETHNEVSVGSSKLVIVLVLVLLNMLGSSLEVCWMAYGTFGDYLGSKNGSDLETDSEQSSKEE
jgi:hypothetical protein